MDLAANIIVGCVALLHLYFLILEMFLWTKPIGLKAFGNTIEKAETTRILAANQGIYNGFLVAGLLWGLIHPDPEFAFEIKIFFLGCVFIAGMYGAHSVHKKIIFIQSLPALIAVILLIGNF